MKEYAETLIGQFRDEELAHAYVDDFLNISIATQIKVLREQRGQTQAKLAELAGMKQSRISVMEDINYPSWSISTLKKLARAFDVSLKVSFESFDTLIADTGNFSEEALKRDTRANSLKKLERLNYDHLEDQAASNESITNMSHKAGKASENRAVIHADSMYAGDRGVDMSVELSAA